MTKTESNYQDFLKTIAMITMVIDHLGLYFFPEYEIMRIIGRTAMPIFCFFAGYNFHTKPKIRILVVGVLLDILTIILFKEFVTTNILIPIFLGQCYLFYFRNSLNNFFYKGYCHVVLLGTLWFCSWFLIDYGTLSMAIMLLGYIAKHDLANLRLTIAISIILSIMHTMTTFQFSSIYVFIVIIFGVLEYIFMVARNFEQKIAINLRIISHNALYIYAIHLAILQFLFFKFYLYS
ncbi:TraX family protein [Candidatus Tisiphia endosymbiont of Hybos culiciformis]|uniref:TraX family protein n=1 Tax=Candidatus Tisiphia endosymbiont of Hybos culiciformis TaxID=3139331 RepID=UPI003CCB0F2E